MRFEGHNKDLKVLVKRQDDAVADIFAALTRIRTATTTRSSNERVREPPWRVFHLSDELHTMLDRLGAQPDLLATLTDEEVLALLREYNPTGRVAQ